MSTRTFRAIAAVVAVATLAGGCASGGSIAGPATSALAPTTTSGTATVDTLAPPTVVDTATAKVDAIDNDFDPKHLEVKAGTKVTFVNAGHNQHNIVPDDPAAADFGIDQQKFQPGTSTSFTFTEPGTYAYYCSLHATATAGSMRGVITVTP
jgi:plastocyanin